MNWDDCRILLEVHRGGSFVVAGQRLQVSPSTVMRRISALERHLGRGLVHRTSRGVQVAAEARGLLELALGFERSLGAREREREGTVRVSVPEGFGALAAQAAQRCRADDPELIVEVQVEARYVDLAARESDLALRGGRSASRVLIERRVGHLDVALLGSRSYLNAHLPSRELTADRYPVLDFIVSERLGQGVGPDRWLIDRGACRFPFRTKSTEARLEAARGGWGLVPYAARVSLPGLEVVKLDRPPPAITFYVAMHRDLRRAPRMRAMGRALAEVFAQYAA